MLLKSNDYPAYYNAFCSVLNEPRKLLCSVHIPRSWERYLKRIVDSEVRAGVSERQSIVKKIIHFTVDVAQSGDNYAEMAWRQALAEEVRMRGFTQYLDYLNEFYFNRKEEWMLRFRTDSRVNINNYCESYHNIMKRTLGQVDRCKEEWIESFDAY